MPTSALSFAVKRCVADRRICVEPQPSTTFSGLTPNFFAIASMSSPALPVVAARLRAAGPNAALMPSSTVLPGPSGFSLLERQIMPGATASSVGSNADHTLFSRPRAPI